MTVLAWLTEPGHAVAAGLGAWLVASRALARYWMTRRPRLDLDLNLAWRLWHWFSGGPFVAWRPPERSRLGRRAPWLRAWTLESGRSAPCVDVPSFVDLLDPGESAEDSRDDPEPDAHMRPLLGCRQRRVAVAAARSASTAGVVAVEYLRLGFPFGSGAATVAAAGLAGTGLLAGAVLAVAYLAVRRAIFLHFEVPAAEAVRSRAGYDKADGTRPRDIARARRVDQYGLDLTITVAPGFEPTDTPTGNKAQLVNDVAVVSGIDLGRVEADWSGLRGWPRVVRFRPARLLPDRVLFNVGSSLVRQTVKVLETQSGPSRPILGWGPGSVPFGLDLDSDSPHLLFSSKSGGGKSVFLKVTAAQLLRWGADLYVLDYKRVSHRWTNGPDGLLDGVRCYARDIESIHHEVMGLFAIVKARYEQCDDLTAEHDLPDYHRVVILCDEVTETIKALRAWWYRQAGNRKKSCPSADALESILNMGRAARVHILGSWQRAEARHVPGQSAGRENFDIKVMVGANKQTFDMLTGGAEFVPPNNRPGWAVVAHGFETTEIQRVLADDDPDGNLAVYRWVGAKRGYQGRHAGTRQSGADRADLARPEPTESTPAFVDDPDPERHRITFRQAVNEGTCPYGSWATAVQARKRARRAGTFPHDPERPDDYGEGDRCYRGELRRWYNDLPTQRRARVEPPEPLVYFLIGGGEAALVAALRAALPDERLTCKVGYTHQPLPKRVRQISGFRMSDVVRVIRVPMPDPNAERPDRWWHDEFVAQLVHEGDADGELLWVRDRFAGYLAAMLRGDELATPDGLRRAERWQPRDRVAA